MHNPSSSSGSTSPWEQCQQDVSALDSQKTWPIMRILAVGEDSPKMARRQGSQSWRPSASTVASSPQRQHPSSQSSLIAQPVPPATYEWLALGFCDEGVYGVVE